MQTPRIQIGIAGIAAALCLTGLATQTSHPISAESVPDSLNQKIVLGSTLYDPDAQEIHLHSFSEEDIPLFSGFSNLKTVYTEDCVSPESILKLREEYPELDVRCDIYINGTQQAWDTEKLQFDSIQLEELAQALPYLPKLTQVDLGVPHGDAAVLLAILETYPDIDFSWHKNVFGVSVSSADTEVDFSGIPLSSTQEIADALAYFPGIQKVIACNCGIDNEQMAAFREKMRPQYKVVWSVKTGRLEVRTDEEWYMPVKYNLSMTDELIYNLRYCEDMVCIDVGHNPITNCEWAAFMPKLKYLIIADTSIKDISPLANHTELVYLEMFLTYQLKDYSPLLTCTALEDLNLGYGYGDPEPIKKMTWLKRLWWACCSTPQAEFQTCLPDTELMLWGGSSTGYGWRNGQHYYDMRDFLDAPYFTG